VNQTVGYLGLSGSNTDTSLLRPELEAQEERAVVPLLDVRPHETGQSGEACLACICRASLNQARGPDAVVPVRHQHLISIHACLSTSGGG
jgi:hypothetical protein